MRKQGFFKDPGWHPAPQELRMGWFLPRLAAAPQTGCLQTLECILGPLWAAEWPHWLETKGGSTKGRQKNTPRAASSNGPMPFPLFASGKT